MRPTPSSGSRPSPGRSPAACSCPTARPTSRAAARCWGRCPGEVVAAAFAVFNPEAVVPSGRVRLGQRRRAHHLRRPDHGRRGPARARPRRRARRARPGHRAARPGRWRRCGPRASRCSPGSSASGCRAIRWVTCGAWPTCCASTAATPTPRRGRRPASTRRRSACSRSSTGACPMRTYIRTRAWSDGQLDEAEGRLVGAWPRGRRSAHR